MKFFKSFVVLCLLVLTLSAKLRKEKKEEEKADTYCCFFKESSGKKYKVMSDGSDPNGCSMGVNYKYIAGKNNCSVVSDALKIQVVKDWADSHPLK